MSKSYTFGEKAKEYNAKTGKDADVWQTPKYKEAKKKAIEALESDLYKNVLTESDFWILQNYTKSGKVAYTGLIISHNGCLKINDALPEDKRFKPSCMSLDKEGYKGSLVYSYQNDDQGVFEVGEVSEKNCTNAYPYAMALKRCMDRVILKNSRLAYSGIYSDSEADEFKKEETEEAKKTQAKKSKKAESAPAPDPTPEQTPTDEQTPTEAVELVVLPDGISPRKALVAYCREKGLNLNDIAGSYDLNNDSSDGEFLTALSDLVRLYGEP